MDQNHTLDAPNNDELSGVEQISDRSDLTGIYREPGKRFEGELLSAEQREKVRAEELEAITSGIGKHALKVGLYVPLPFISGLLIVAALFSVAGMIGQMARTFLAMFAIAVWLFIAYRAYAAIFKTFYKHALRAGPFLVIMLASIMMASQAIYWIVSESYAGQSLLFNAALMSLLLVLYSLIASYILLGIWGNSKLNSGIKALVSGLVLIVSAFFVVATYLL
jgi:cation transport ATPase